MSATDTIFAQSSGAGAAGVAVIRISGPGTAAAIATLAGPPPAPRRAALRWIIDPETGERLDSGLVLFMPAPRSFTGEDCAEFQIHGSRATVAAVLRALARVDGLRPAMAGEFSRRAYRNGRLDLFEAEALADLVNAQTDAQRRQALRLALGDASDEIEAWRKDIIAMLAHAEAAIDFADEDDVVRAAAETIAARASLLTEKIALSLEHSAAARLLRDGVRVVIAGPPNAGKSQLLNRLARRDAAIVSSTPGTTRDVIEVALELGGVPVLLSDTAGLRGETDDAVEAEGMARARAVMQDAQIVLWVTAPDAEAEIGPTGVPPEVITVRNKSDLAPAESRLIRNDSRMWSISAETGDGVEALLAEIGARAQRMSGAGNSVVFTRERQLSAARQASIHLRNILDGGGLTMELVAEELRGAAFQIGRITGRVDVEDLLDSIFREFCIGK